MSTGTIGFKNTMITQGVMSVNVTETPTRDYAVMYLDWVNNFLSVERFAEYYGLRKSEAREILRTGKVLHEEKVRQIKLASNVGT